MSIVFEDRESTYPNRCKVTPLDGTPFYAVIERADEPIVVGTPLNAETLNGMQESLLNDIQIESPSFPGCYYRMVNGEMEWINPPRTLGVVYRTSERFMGRPVYVRQFETKSFTVGRTWRSQLFRDRDGGMVFDAQVFAVIPNPTNGPGAEVIYPLPFALADGGSTMGFYIHKNQYDEEEDFSYDICVDIPSDFEGTAIYYTAKFVKPT